MLVIDDQDIAGLVRDVLEEEGLAVSILTDTASESVRAAVARVAPDCVLLDGAGHGDYGPSWLDAAWIHGRERPIPVIMFTASMTATDEAQADESVRSRSAAFAGVLPKPFALEDLIALVAEALGRS